MNKYAFALIAICIYMSCNNTTQQIDKLTIDIQGHRGCRGLMPENSLPAFQKAMELRVNTLEMDLAISQDEMVVVSHEPFFREGIAISPEGDTIGANSEERYNLFKMPYSEIKKYVIGTVPDPNHPNREDIKTYKPLFRRVVRNTQDYAHTMEEEEPFYNIEIKRNPKHDGIFHPPVEKFVDLVLAEIRELGIEEKVIIQSFDLESLRLTKTKNPRIPLALLIENENSAKTNIEALGFKPAIYSSYFKFLTQEEVDYCHEKGIKVIPWTVNTKEDIDQVVSLGVDGIISDYPDRVIEVVR